MQQIKEFNDRLVRQDSRYDLLEYVKQINSLSNEPIDLSFMEELLSFIEQDTCCIPHSLLVKYGVISDNKDASYITKRLLEQYEFKDQIDFKLDNVVELGNNGKHYNKINYFLHPRIFRFCLMRAKNTKLYAKYYLLLEDSIKYYHDYQLMYKDYILSMKDDKIDNLEKKIDKISKENAEQTKVMNEQSKEIKELLGYTTSIKTDINNLIDLTVEQIEESELAKVETQVASKDRINKPASSCNIECMAIIKNTSKELPFKMIRGTYTYVKLTIGRLTGTKFARVVRGDEWSITENGSGPYEFIKAYSNVPNARHLFRAFKISKNTNNSNTIKSVVGINFSSDLSDFELLDQIQYIFDNRLTIEVEERDRLLASKSANKKIREVKSKIKYVK
jgi:hypothetical protein